MNYDGTNEASRKALAEALCAKLEACGFTRKANTTDSVAEEAVFGRAHHKAGSIEVLVYTSASLNYFGSLSTRGVGKDAIRVAAVYTTKNGETRGVGSAKRVNRVGDVADIVTRTHERMREVYGAAASLERCKCGAPKFTSKKGKLVCAELCWLNK